MTATASILLRLSKDPKDTSTGLKTQEADLRRVAAAEGLTVIAVHVDEGISGALRVRKGLQAWLKDGRRGHTLMTWKVDRYSRGGIAALGVLLDVVAGVNADGVRLYHGCRFIATQDGLDSTSPAWEIQAAMLAWLAKEERSAITSRIKRAQEERRAQGRWNGGTVPFGLRVIPNPDGAGKVLEVEPAEAAALVEAARMMLSGTSLMKTSRWMNAHGPRPRRASQWSGTSLRFALLNSEGGRRVLSPGERASLSSILTDPSRLTRNSATARRHPKRLLSGVLHCATCGGLMYVRWNAKVADYRCTARPDGRQCTQSVTITAAGVEEIVAREWLSANGDREELVLRRTADERADRLAVAKDRVAELREQLSTADRRSAAPSWRTSTPPRRPLRRSRPSP